MPVCDILTVEQAPEADEKYALVIDFLNTTITIKSDQYAANPSFQFNITELNENFEYTGQIFREDGTLVEIVIDGVSYDCIKFKTKVNVEFVYT